MPIGVYLVIDRQPHDKDLISGDLVWFDNPRPDIVPAAKLIKEIVELDHETATMIVQGHHPASFDSRFFGPVPTKGVRKIIPLIVEEKL